MYHVSNQQTSTIDYLIIAFPCSFSTLEAAIQKCEAHPFASRKKPKFPNLYNRRWKERLLLWEHYMGHFPITIQHTGASGTHHRLTPGLAAIQNLPKIWQERLIFGKDRLKLQPSELFISSAFTKWNHHEAIYLDHISSATHRNTSMSWDPLLHPQLLLRIDRKYQLLKNISTVSTKQQLKALSVMSLNIPHINIPLRMYCPQNTEAYGWNGILTLSDNNSMPHPVSLCALASRKLSTKFSAQL